MEVLPISIGSQMSRFQSTTPLKIKINFFKLKTEIFLNLKNVEKLVRLFFKIL